MCKINKQMHEKHIDQPPLAQARRSQCQTGLTKHEDKEQSNGKYHFHAGNVNKNKTRVHIPQQESKYRTNK